MLIITFGLRRSVGCPVYSCAIIISGCGSIAVTIGDVDDAVNTVVEALAIVVPKAAFRIFYLEKFGLYRRNIVEDKRYCFSRFFPHSDSSKDKSFAIQ